MPANSKYDEPRLLQQLSAGNEEAMKQLFDRYYDKLLKYIAAFVKSELIAEELVMDVFMKIWLGRDIATEIKSLDAFLYRVAKNKSIDFLRSAARDSGLKQLLFKQMEVIASGRPDEKLMLQEFEYKVREAIDMLSPQRKKVYLISREEELTHDEIANRIGISRNTVNNHIVMARQFIRDYLIRNMDIASLVLFCSNYF